MTGVGPHASPSHKPSVEAAPRAGMPGEGGRTPLMVAAIAVLMPGVLQAGLGQPACLGKARQPLGRSPVEAQCGLGMAAAGIAQCAGGMVFYATRINVADRRSG